MTHDEIERKPVKIGGYRVVRCIAEGAMGVVYEGEQEHPRRRVAIKVARTDSQSDRLPRFEQEAQLLARLRHPGIAQILEAGTTHPDPGDPDAGAQPFFVMEFVDGQPITSYAAAQAPTVRAKLELIVAVCEAVGFAHAQGVVHRDLKPDNVLVEPGGQPRVLDFGVAKVTAASGHDAAHETRFGQVFGTPGYMAPEQLSGKTDEIGPAADVYSLGVLIYELLTGRLPHELDAVPLSEALAIVTGADAPPLGSVRPELRGDLEAVVAKALEKHARHRYADATGLAADIQRFLRDEPVLAKPHSTLHRARKFARRHPGLVGGVAAAMVTLLLGLVTTLVLLGRAERKVREFDQLAINVRHVSAVARMKQFYPAWPDKIPAMESWLENDCAELLAMRAAIERTVSALRARALPWTEAEQEDDLRAHEQYGSWQTLGKRLKSLRYAQEIRTGSAPLVVPELTGWQRGLHVDMLCALSAERCWSMPEGRAVYGQEALGLAYARAALAKAGDGVQKAKALECLAWALVSNGQDAEARARGAEAVAKTPEAIRPALARAMKTLERVVTGLPLAEAEYAKLTAEVHARRTWRFATDDEASRFLHDSLTKTLRMLEQFEASVKPEVERHLSWARALRRFSTRGHPNARVSWADARAAIAKADGVVASELYAGRNIELREEDVIGLVPIGMNPTTKLWEFYDLRSAWDGKTDPGDIAIPELRESNGKIDVTADTGIVFVLLPGGTVLLGAQRDDEAGPNYDRNAKPREIVHELTLAPFFMSRYELTQAQWARLMTWDPNLRHPSLRVGPGPTQPVEGVTWYVCNELATRHGMVLPTEAQWEYACRGGRSTPWWFGRKPRQVVGKANVLDRDGASADALQGTPEPFHDGFERGAPVGSFAPNPFGLYDVHGNVWEWCRDQRGNYGSERPGDGLRPEKFVSGADGHVRRFEQYVYRGGGFDARLPWARSACRHENHGTLAHSAVGFRCARPVRR